MNTKANPRPNNTEPKPRRFTGILLLLSALLVTLAAAIGGGSWLLHHHQIRLNGLSYLWSSQTLAIDEFKMGPDGCAILHASDVRIATEPLASNRRIILHARRLQLNPACLLPSSDATPQPKTVTLPDLAAEIQLKIEQLEITDIAILHKLNGLLTNQEIRLLSEVQQQPYAPYNPYLPERAELAIHWHQADEQLSIELSQQQGVNVSLAGQLHTNGTVSATGLISGQQAINGEHVELSLPITLELNQQVQTIELQQGTVQYHHHQLQLDSKIIKQQQQLSSTSHFSILSSPANSAAHNPLTQQLISGELELIRRGDNPIQGQWRLDANHYALSNITANLPEALAEAQLNSRLHGTISGTPSDLNITSLPPGKLSLNNSHWDPQISIFPNIVLQLHQTTPQGYRVNLIGDIKLRHSNGSSQLTASLATNSHNSLITGSIRGNSHITPTLQGNQQAITLAHHISLQGPISAPTMTLQHANATLNLSWQQTLTAQSSLTLTNPATIWPPQQQTELNASGALEQIYWQQQPLPPSQIALSWTPQQPINALLDWQPGQLQLSINPYTLNGKLILSALPLTGFSPFFPPELTLNSGIADAEAKLELDQQQQLNISGNVSITALSGLINEVAIIDASSNAQLQATNHSLQINGQLNIEQINPGFAITDINSQYQIQQHEEQLAFQLSNLSAQLFNGRLSSKKLHYPSNTLAMVKLHQLQLNALSQLQSEPAVILTGALDAELPLSINQDGITITNGKFVNRGVATMEIIDKTLLEQYIQANPALEFALRPLEQLDIYQLAATMDLEPNGAMQLNAKIQGENAQQPHPLHLNYQHQENLLDLLTSIRLSDTFQQQIEEALQNNRVAGGI